MNPGSVGLQAYYDAEHEFPYAMETGSPHALCVIGQVEPRLAGYILCGAL